MQCGCPPGPRPIARLRVAAENAQTINYRDTITQYIAVVNLFILFCREQTVEIVCTIQDILDQNSELSNAREKALEDICCQIDRAVPHLETKLQQYRGQEGSTQTQTCLSL